MSLSRPLLYAAISIATLSANPAGAADANVQNFVAATFVGYCVDSHAGFSEIESRLKADGWRSVPLKSIDRFRVVQRQTPEAGTIEEYKTSRWAMPIAGAEPHVAEIYLHKTAWSDHLTVTEVCNLTVWAGLSEDEASAWQKVSFGPKGYAFGINGWQRNLEKKPISDGKYLNTLEFARVYAGESGITLQFAREQAVEVH
jgi:hypothetical protein